MKNCDENQNLMSMLKICSFYAQTYIWIHVYVINVRVLLLFRVVAKGRYFFYASPISC